MLAERGVRTRENGMVKVGEGGQDDNVGTPIKLVRSSAMPDQ